MSPNLAKKYLWIRESSTEELCCSYLFHLHAVFGKNWQNDRLAITTLSYPPPLLGSLLNFSGKNWQNNITTLGYSLPLMKILICVEGCSVFDKIIEYLNYHGKQVWAPRYSLTKLRHEFLSVRTACPPPPAAYRTTP